MRAKEKAKQVLYEIFKQRGFTFMEFDMVGKEGFYSMAPSRHHNNQGILFSN